MFSELGDLLEARRMKIYIRPQLICYSMQQGLVEEAMGKAGSQVQHLMQL
jgi:hypothetical protein